MVFFFFFLVTRSHTSVNFLDLQNIMAMPLNSKMYHFAEG